MNILGSLEYGKGSIISFDDTNVTICENYYISGWFRVEWKQRLQVVSRYMIYDTYENMMKGIKDRFNGNLVYSGKCLDLKIGQQIYFTVFKT